MATHKNKEAESAKDSEGTPSEAVQVPQPSQVDGSRQNDPRQKEIGGRDGPDPTRFGDWEKGGRCIDF